MRLVHFVNYSFNYISLEDVDNGQLRSYSEQTFKNAPSRARRKIRKGDVLISTVRPNLKSHLLISNDVQDFVCSTGFAVLRNNGKIDSVFLYNHFFSSIINRQIENLITGSNYPAINSKEVKSLVIPIPPLPEQTAIANALSDMDALISQTEKLIEKKKAIKQGAMQELLTGATRLDEFGIQRGYKTTEYGKIPKDWDMKKLGDLGENIIGLTYSPNDVSEYGHLVLRSSNIQNNKLAFGNNVFVNMELPNRVIVKENDILICVRNGSKNLIGKCALIDTATEGCAFGAFMSVYRTRFAKYIYHQFQSTIIQNQIDQVMGATINQLTNKDLSTFKIPVPQNIHEQTAIANVLSDMDIYLGRAQIKLTKLKQQKQGMMQALLSGKIRLA
jgi:type I restriction enzyme S subunit